MKRLGIVLFLVAAAGFAWWLMSRRSGPPEAPFAKVQREKLISQLATNGKVEPLEASVARAERDGLVSSVPVERGQSVTKGTVLAVLAAPREAQSLISSAEARVASIQAELATFDRGGRSAELAEIDGSIAGLRQEIQKVEKDLVVSRRLVERKAAPASEVTELESRRSKAAVEIESLERRRRSLTVASDRTATEARLRDAQAALRFAQQQSSLNVVRAPQAGVVYNVAVRKGSFARTGDVVAEIGRLDRLKVIVYVDEPEMGAVRQGQPVRITWDAKAGREWTGVVDKMPTQIVSMGTRQVAEVVTIAENPERDLLPGANVNAEIRTSVVESALTVPKEALRPENGGFAVLVLENGNQLKLRPVKLGATSATRAEIVSGLKDGDAVALPSDQSLAPGQIVQPIFP